MLLLVGASVRALLESAVESGFHAMGIDFFGDTDNQGEVVTPYDGYGLSPNTMNLLTIARDYECSGLVYGAGPENHGQALNFWEERGLLLGNGCEALASVRNPYLLRDVLENAGFKMPNFFGTDEFQAVKPQGSWLLKPVFRGGGHGIIKLSEGGEPEKVISLLKEPERYIVQENVDGVPASMTFLSDGASALTVGFSRQLISEGGEDDPFRYDGNIVPFADPGSDLWNKMTCLSSVLTKSFGLRGINTLDFILSRGGVWVLELNPRWSGSSEVIEAWLGKRLFREHVNACKGELPDSAEWEEMLGKLPKGYFAKKILYSDDSYNAKNFGEEWKSLFAKGIRDIPRPGFFIRAGDPICTVLGDGASIDECMQDINSKTHMIHDILLTKGRD